MERCIQSLIHANLCLLRIFSHESFPGRVGFIDSDILIYDDENDADPHHDPTRVIKNTSFPDPDDKPENMRFMMYMIIWHLNMILDIILETSWRSILINYGKMISSTMHIAKSIRDTRLNPENPSIMAALRDEILGYSVNHCS